MESNPYKPPVASLDVPAVPPGTPARIGFWPRVGAALLDFVVVAVAGVLLSGLGASLFPDHIAHLMEEMTKSRASADPNAAAAMEVMTKVFTFFARWSVGVSLFGIVYWWLEGITGRAVGKRLLGLRIADVNGRAASVERLLGRVAIKQSGAILAFVAMFTRVYALESVSKVIGVVLFIGLFFVLGSQKRTLHDLIAGTAVYKAADVTVAPRA